ncbi:MAG TPA: adenylate/guanylate cyclase domain-containing protein [Roseiflexaceae bacterium]|nr:adenylate/guanylate cyclase domain-containing protein [Roseiflexaceae bacterium]
MRDLANEDTALLQALVPASILQPMRDGSAEAMEDACGVLRTTLDTLMPFVPAPALGLQLARPGRIAGQYLSGTVMLADLSGFTSLANQLSTLGRQGNEALSAVVNRLFTGLLEDLHSHGGGLIKFGGDGLTAFFDSSRLGGQHAALACAAALAMQRRMADFAALPTPAGTFALHLRLAAQSGRVFAVEVGDSNHIELVVTGRAINRVVTALEAASPGELIVSDDTLSLLKQPLASQKLTGLHVLRRLKAPPQPPAPAAWQSGPPSPATLSALLQRIAVLRPYVPYGLPARYLTPAAEDEGEFRPVLVMFANFYAFSRFLSRLELWASLEQDTTLLGQIINTYFTRTQDVVQQHGGSINKIDMATFGDRLMALFGAPLAQEDSTARGVRAALVLDEVINRTNEEVAERLRAWTDAHPDQRSLLQVVSVSMRPRIGIAAGQVFAGLVGTRQRHEYTVMGATVHLAARLMAAAENGDVLLTSLARRAVGSALEAEALPPIILKGIDQSVPVFRAQSWNDAWATSMALARRTPFQGRADERQRLLEIARQAFSRGAEGGRIVTLVGEAGMGKSRLIDETLIDLRAQFPDLQIVQAAGQSYEQSSPYALIGALMRQAIQPPLHMDLQARAGWLQALLDELVPDWSRFAPLLGPLLNLPLSETPLLQTFTPEQRHDRLHDLITHILVAMAQRRPLALVADDLHWADASSITVLNQLALMAGGSTLLLALLSRTPVEPPEGCPPELLTAINLTELSSDESEAMTRALLDGAVPDDLRRLIARNGGTPLFLEETLRYLLDTGALTRTYFGSWTLTRELDQVSVPVQIEQMITARLDRLDEETRSLLQIAAVIGQRFEARLLEALTPQQRAREQRLADLVSVALLVPEPNEAQAIYSFRNAITHAVIYDSILFARRAELHSQIAAAIERLYGGDLRPHHNMLAEHYLRAEQFERAFPHLLGAAQEAQHRFALAEATTLYQQAQRTAPWEIRETTPDLPLATALYEGYGDMLALTGDYAAARQSYELLLRLLGQHADRASALLQATIQRKIGNSYEYQGSMEMALDWLAQAETTLNNMQPGPEVMMEQAQVLGNIGWVRFRQSRQDEALQLLESALARLDGLSAPDEMARILNRLGGVAYSRGNLDLARQYVERSLEASRESGNLVVQARALGNLGNLAGNQGLMDDAVQYGLQAIEINERIGNRRDLAYLANNVGYAFFDSQEYDAALAYFKQAITYALEIRDTFAQMMAALSCGRALAALGRWDDAESSVQQSQFIAIQLRLPVQQMDCHVVLGELALQRGDLPAAEEEYQQCIPLIDDKETEDYGRFQRLEARIALAHGERERALALLNENMALFERLKNRPEVERTRRLLGEMNALIAEA